MDLVMWTLNGQSTLPACLRSIEKAVPKKHVDQKIVVDGHSIDNTQQICREHGWTVIDADKLGIPYQANQALSMVETEYYVSFEQDIRLHPNWFNTITRHLQDKQVAVAQGVRVATNPTMRHIELDSLHNQTRYTSLDNTIYHTKTIKQLGGYNPKYPLSTDRDLQDRVRNAGYKWIEDRTIISDHMKHSIKQYVRKIYHDAKICKYTKDHIPFKKIARLFVTSPFRASFITLKTRNPLVMFAYPYLRLQFLRGYYATERAKC